MQNRSEEITQEIPSIMGQRSGYEPDGLRIEMKFCLTEHQEQTIDKIAKQLNIKHWAALELLWNEMYSQFVQNIEQYQKYNYVLERKTITYG